MTTLGLEFLKLGETQRSNQAHEAETFRHNSATETENFRHNSATETLESSKQKETNRHNLANELNDLRRIAGTTGLIDAAMIINPNMSKADKIRLNAETTGNVYQPYSRTVASVLGKATPTIGAGLLGAAVGSKAGKKPSKGKDVFTRMNKQLDRRDRANKFKSSAQSIGKTLASTVKQLGKATAHPFLVTDYQLQLMKDSMLGSQQIN